MTQLLDAEADGEALAALAPAAAGVPPALWERALFAPVRDLLARPGKEFRGRLVEAAWRLAGGAGGSPAPLSAMLEIIHAGSMIIDDVEDGSTHRRGGLTIHRLHGVPLAINAGNWMYFWPFALLESLRLAPDRELALRRRMTKTMFDCHYGQALDLEARVGELPQRELPDVVATITALKTGRLMELAALVGALAAGAEASLVEALARFGHELGVGLQMLDDLGNLLGRAEPEKRHEDLRLRRATWPWAWAAELCDEPTFEALERDLAAATPGSEGAVRFDQLATALRAAIGPHGKLAAHWHLDRASAALRAAVGPHPVLAAIEAEISRLEESYG